MKLKISLTAVGVVVLACLCAVFIPEPYGAILAVLIGLAGGFLLRKLIIKALEQHAKNNKNKV